MFYYTCNWNPRSIREIVTEKIFEAIMIKKKLPKFCEKHKLTDSGSSENFKQDTFKANHT